MASVPGNWDRQLSYDAATNILQQNPDIVGFYANNDGMALGVVEAVKAAGKLQDKIAVIGTDGISDAYKSIKAGELTAHRRLVPGADRRGRPGSRRSACTPARSCRASSRRPRRWSRRTTSTATPATRPRCART